MDKKEKVASQPIITGYCMKCKAKQTMKDPKPVTMKNGRPAKTGKCTVCGTTIFRIGE